MSPRTKKRRFGLIEGLEDRQLMAADLVGGIVEPVEDHHMETNLMLYLHQRLMRHCDASTTVQMRGMSYSVS